MHFTWILALCLGLVLALAAGCQTANSAGGASGGSWWNRSSPQAAPAKSGGDVEQVQHTEPVEEPPPIATDYKTNSQATEDVAFDEQLAVGLKTIVGRGPDEKVARAAYSEGEELFRQKKYAEAAAKFDEAGDRWPKSILEEDAMFMRAESLFFADDYAASHEQFGELLNTYENSRHLDASLQRQFAIANFWLQTHQQNPSKNYVPNLTDDTRPWIDLRGRTVKAFENIHLKDPTGPLADDALFAAAGIQFASGRWDEADFLYDQLLQNHADSKYLAKAQYLSVRAKLRRYQGAAYDGKPLEEAEQRMLQMLNENPGDIPDAPEGERTRLVQAKAAVRLQIAERELAMGVYYEGRGQYQAARFYYQLVSEEYRDTPLAKQATEKLAELKDKQDLPSRFNWLDKLFPEKNRFPTPANGPPTS